MSQRKIEAIIPSDLVIDDGDMRLWRALPVNQRESLGPFVFLDHYRHQSQRGIGDSPHPHAGIEVISYLLVFAAAYIILSFIISLIKHVMDFPILKQLDWLAGGVFGVLRGGVLVYLLLLLVPLISTVLPADGIGKLIADSSLAHLFSSDGFFIRVISQ